MMIENLPILTEQFEGLQERAEAIAECLEDKVGNGRSYNPQLGKGIMASVLIMSPVPQTMPQNEEEKQFELIVLTTVKNIMDGFLYPVPTLIASALQMGEQEYYDIVDNGVTYKGDLLRWLDLVMENVVIQNAIRGNINSEMKKWLDMTRFNGRNLPYETKAEIANTLTNAQQVANLQKKYAVYIEE